MKSHLALLDCLHDAVLHWVRIDFDSDSRIFSFSVTCNPDCGDPEFDDKTFLITARDIAIIRCCVHGRIVGDESIRTCHNTLSRDTEQILTTGTSAGLFDPSGRLSIVTHSGSEWEVAFQSLTVSPA